MTGLFFGSTNFFFKFLDRVIRSYYFHRFNFLSRLSRLERRYFDFIFKVGYLRKLEKGVCSFCSHRNDRVYKVFVPDDVFSLLSVPDLQVSVWHFNSVSYDNMGVGNLFRLDLSGSGEVPAIDILYDLALGIQEIVVHGFWFYEDWYICRVPRYYFIADFVEVLNGGALRDFVFKYCINLSKSQIKRIRKQGLC